MRSDPNWSPDGTSLVFSAFSQDGEMYQYPRLANPQSVARAGIGRTVLTSLVARRSLHRGAVRRLLKN